MPSRPENDCWNSCVAYIDGGSRGNPGVAGYGVHIVDEQGKTLADISKGLGVKTNNAAEYSALIAALKFARSKHCQKLKVMADSQLLVRQINGEYRIKSPDLKVLFREAQSLITGFKSFSVHHIPREENKEADRLANLAMDGTNSSCGPPPLVNFPLQLSAVFQNGCFKPLESVDLPENSRVCLNIVRAE